MAFRARFLAAVHAVLFGALVTCALAGLVSPAAAQIFWRLPAGWSEDIEETYWIAYSRRDTAGFVSLIRPAAMAVSGTREAAFAQLAEQWAAMIGGTIVERGPAGEFMPRYSTLSRTFSIRGAQRQVLSLQVVGHFWRTQPQSYADVYLVMAPEALARSERDGRWEAGIKHVRYLIGIRSIRSCRASCSVFIAATRS